MFFAEVKRIFNDFPHECLTHDQMWSDTSEKANGVTRDKKSGVLCYSLWIIDDEGVCEMSFGVREDSSALQHSELFARYTALISPYERL